MGLEKIKEELQQKAKQVEKDILADAKKQCSEIDSSSSAEIKALQQSAKTALDNQVQQVTTREQAAQEMIGQKSVFEARKKILDETFADAFEKIASMSGKDRKSVTTKLFENARKEIDVATVYVNKADKALVSGVDVQESDMAGGIIAESKDGSVRVDYSFETLFDEIKKDCMKKASQELFGE